MDRWDGEGRFSYQKASLGFTLNSGLRYSRLAVPVGSSWNLEYLICKLLLNVIFDGIGHGLELFRRQFSEHGQGDLLGGAPLRNR